MPNQRSLGFRPNGDGTGVIDIPDAWLVKISGSGIINMVSYKSLIP